VLELWDGTRKSDKQFIHSHKPTQSQQTSWLTQVGAPLVLGRATGNLGLIISFGHDLCCICPNGSCETILDIYASIAFQWYKKLFKARGFALWNRSLKFWESTGTPTPKMGVHLGVWMFILTLSHTPGLLFWPALLWTFALVTSLKLGLRQLKCLLQNFEM
jgi:hypothetical protein